MMPLSNLLRETAWDRLKRLLGDPRQQTDRLAYEFTARSKADCRVIACNVLLVNPITADGRVGFWMTAVTAHEGQTLKTVAGRILSEGQQGLYWKTLLLRVRPGGTLKRPSWNIAAFRVNEDGSLRQVIEEVPHNRWHSFRNALEAEIKDSIIHWSQDPNYKRSFDDFQGLFYVDDGEIIDELARRGHRTIFVDPLPSIRRWIDGCQPLGFDEIGRHLQPFTAAND